MKRLLLILIAAAIFGAVSAYVSAQIFNSIHVDSERPQDHWFDSFMILLTPGGIIDHLIYGNASGFNLPYEDSIEGDSLNEAVVFNALGWMLIFAVLTYLIWSIKWALRAIVRAHNSHAR